LFLSLWLFLVNGCTSRVESEAKNVMKQPVQPVVTPVISSQKDCELLGGIWGPFGMLAVEDCNLPSRDAGQPCKDHSECQSSCITDESVPAGQKVVGRCYEWTITRGTCLNEVWKSVAQGVICVD